MMKLKNRSSLAFAVSVAISGTLLASNTVLASDDTGTFSANIALTTDYYFRGISQTNNDGAVSGGFDWSHESGLYAGVWASNVAFGSTNIEADTYIGFANEVNGIGYDLGWLRYNYNDTASSDDPDEFYLNLSYSFFSAGYAYSPDWFGSDEKSHYAFIGIDYDLPNDIGLSASVGRSFGDAYEDYEYTDYKIGINKDFYGINFDLSYVDNNLSSKDCTTGLGLVKSNCEGRFILTASKSIDDTRASGSSDMPISANLTLVTDYYFRGISQTMNDGAVQGGFDYVHESGAYAGIWASNLYLGGSTNIEVDLYLGFANEINDFGYDVGWVRYTGNDTDSDEDADEFYINLSYSLFSAGYAYSSDWFGSDEESNYIYLGVDYGLPYDVGVSASIGRSFGDTYGDAEYVDYSVGLSKDIAGITFDLSYVDNDLSNSECGDSTCDGRFILSATKEF